MHRLLAMTIVWAVLAPLAAADPLDRLLSTPGTAPLPQGVALIYRHRRVTGQEEGAATERAISVQRHPERAIVTATVTATVAATPKGDGAVQTAEFRGTTGNPIVLVFLDAVVSRVSEATGANPFYLRRRIKEVAREQIPIPSPEPGESGEIVLRPLAGTEHADALGIFAGLELIFHLSDAVPGRVVALRARAGEGADSFTEEMLLDGTT